MLSRCGILFNFRVYRLQVEPDSVSAGSGWFTVLEFPSASIFMSDVSSRFLGDYAGFHVVASSAGEPSLVKVGSSVERIFS